MLYCHGHGLMPEMVTVQMLKRRGSLEGLCVVVVFLFLFGFISLTGFAELHLLNFS